MSGPEGRGPRAFPATPDRAASIPQPDPQTRPPRAINDLNSIAIEADDALEREALEQLDAAPARDKPRRSRFPLGRLFFGALGAVVSLMIGLTLDQLVRDLFARADWLGWTALGAAILLVATVVAIVLREVLALFQLKAVENERRDVAEAFAANADAPAQAAVKRLGTILGHRTEIAAGRRRMESLAGDVIDGRDRLTLAERELLLPLDARARALILGSSKRVSVVTAVSPRAFMDLLFVLFETVRLIRRMSELYGARPGAIGLVKLTRDVLAHLAVTGTIAIGDGIVQQVVGHGLAARLSAKLGEGVVNGLLTARVGLAAMDLCRPMPFLAVKRPSMGQFLNELTRFTSEVEPQGGRSEAPR